MKRRVIQRVVVLLLLVSGGAIVNVGEGIFSRRATIVMLRRIQSLTSCGRQYLTTLGGLMTLCFILEVALMTSACTARMNQDRSAAAAGASPTHVYSDERILSTYPEIVIATVKAVTPGPANTNGDPPLVTVSIERIIRGSLVEGEMTAIWEPFPHAIDWSDQGTEEAIRKWSAQRLAPPAVDSRWIFCGKDVDGVFEIAPRCRFEVSPERVAWVNKTLSAARQQELQQAVERKAQRAQAMLEWERASVASDMPAMFDSSTLVVSARRLSSVGTVDGPMYLWEIHRYWKGRPSKKPPSLWVIMTATTEQVESIDRIAGESVVLFLRESRTGTESTEAVEEWQPVDPRRFMLTNGTAGIMPATPERQKTIEKLAKEMKQSLTPK